MQFDTKFAIVVRDDLETWQKLNVTAFLTSGIIGNTPEMGIPLLANHIADNVRRLAGGDELMSIASGLAVS